MTRPAKAMRRFGVRGCAMLLCAYLWMLLGVGAILDAPFRAPGAFHLLIPAEIRGALWVASALVAVLVCRSKVWSWVGLAVLSLMPALCMSSYAWSWVIYWLQDGTFPHGWYLASFHLGFLGLVAVAAAVPSPDERTQSAIAIVKGEE